MCLSLALTGLALASVIRGIRGHGKGSRLSDLELARVARCRSRGGGYSLTHTRTLSVYSHTHSLTRNHSFHSLIHVRIHSHTHSFCLLTHSLTHTQSFCPLTHTRTHSVYSITHTHSLNLLTQSHALNSTYSPAHARIHSITQHSLG